MTETSAAASLTALVRAELATESARKSSLEQRGLAVITSSGTLVTLLFAIGTVSRGEQLTVEGVARTSLFVALFCFILAAISGIIANWPWKTGAVPLNQSGGLRDLVGEESFHLPGAAVDRRIAEMNVAQIALLREVNNRKAKALLFGLAFEVLAILSVGLVIAAPLVLDLV